MSFTLRPERRGDEGRIHAVTAAAFAGTAHSDGREPAIVDRLRIAGDLALSLVALDEETAIIGHIAFSPVDIADGTQEWFGLGPLSVIPAWQRRGVGSALVERGLADLRQAGGRGCVLLGDPGYYGRFGFAADPRLTYSGPPSEYFQMLQFGSDLPVGEVRYAPAFG